MRKIAMTMLGLCVTLGATDVAAQRPARPARPETPARPQRPERPERPPVPSPGWIGVSLKSAGPDDASLVVSDVLPDSPARKAGIQKGDTIVLWNGRRDVSEAMRDRRVQPGDTVRLRVRRDGERDRDVAVVAEDRPTRLVEVRRGRGGEEVLILAPGALAREMRHLSDSLAVHADSLHHRLQGMLRDSLGPRLRELERLHMPELEAHLRALEARLPRMDGERIVVELGRRSVAGAEFAEVNEGLASYFGTDRGALVLKVAPDTPAARAGLQAGDVIVKAAGKPVATVAELRRAVAQAGERDSDEVALEVLRKGQRRKIEMRWE